MAWWTRLAVWALLMLYSHAADVRLQLNPASDRWVCEGDSVTLNWTYTPSETRVPLLFWLHQDGFMMRKTDEGVFRYENYEDRTDVIPGSNAGVKIDKLQPKDSGVFGVELAGMDIEGQVNVQVQAVNGLIPSLTVDNNIQKVNSTVKIGHDDFTLISVSAPRKAREINIRINGENSKCHNSTVCTHSTSLHPTCVADDDTVYTNVIFIIKYDVCEPQQHFLTLASPCGTPPKTALIVCLVLFIPLVLFLVSVIAAWVILRKRQRKHVERITKKQAMFVNWKYLDRPLTRLTKLNRYPGDPHGEIPSSSAYDDIPNNDPEPNTTHLPLVDIEEDIKEETKIKKQSRWATFKKQVIELFSTKSTKPQPAQPAPAEMKNLLPERGGALPPTPTTQLITETQPTKRQMPVDVHGPSTHQTQQQPRKNIHQPLLHPTQQQPHKDGRQPSTTVHQTPTEPGTAGARVSFISESPAQGGSSSGPPLPVADSTVYRDAEPDDDDKGKEKSKKRKWWFSKLGKKAADSSVDHGAEHEPAGDGKKKTKKKKKDKKEK